MEPTTSKLWSKCVLLKDTTGHSRSKNVKYQTKTVKSSSKIVFKDTTPGPLYKKFITAPFWVQHGPFIDPKWSNFAIYMHLCILLCYNTDWITNTQIVLDPNNSVIKRLRCNKNPPHTFCKMDNLPGFDAISGNLPSHR